MKNNLIALLCGLIFGMGLTVSQMVNPVKIQNFLDIAGNWDPSLAFVMIGALTVTTLAFRVILKRPAPLFDASFHVTKRKDIDRPLLFGAALFGAGWGLSGYCPGPAFAGMGLLNTEAFIMVIAIYIGFFTHQFLLRKKAG